MKSTLATLALLTALAPSPSHAVTSPFVISRHVRGPGIRLWTNGEVFRRHDRVRVYFRTEQDAFVLILRVDTDGRLEVLFPRRPDEDNFVYGGRTHTASSYGRDAFYVDDYPGLGYVFAVASTEPLDLEQLADRDRWDVRLVAEGRIHGDPYGELHDLAARLLPADYSDYDTHLLPYYVERRYDYPRFVCYDCHAFVSWTLWDPYRYWCSRYTLVVYNDPFYYYPSYWYPTRYYGGTRVVYVRPGAREGRFVFRTREGAAPAIEYRDRRTTGAAGAERRPPERGVRGADIGGVGSIPVPGRRTVDGEPGGLRDVPTGDRAPVIGGRRTVDPPPVRPAAPREPAREPTVDTRRRTDEPARPVEAPLVRPRPERQPDLQPRDARPEVRPEGRRAPEAGADRPSAEPEPRAVPYRPPASARPAPERPQAERPRAEPRRESPPPRAAEPRASTPPPRSEPQSRPSGGGGLVRRRPD
ncbi:MAG TPA: DUF4384 domain-containing protein [Gemmatimonadales bacterium]|nr:DUF4384 domain-containing protein [Gemmatimonadales bacterium]